MLNQVRSPSPKRAPTTFVDPFSYEELVQPVQPVVLTKHQRKKKPRRHRTVEKLVPPTFVDPYEEPVEPVHHRYPSTPKAKRSYPHKNPQYQWKNNESFYNLTKDLIPDLKEVAKPPHWNVRDFSAWQTMFSPRSGAGLDTVTTTRRPSRVDEVSPLRINRVTFGNLLMREPHQPRFSRLIRHDADRRSDISSLSKRHGKLHYNERMPRDSFSRGPGSAWPSFDISFEDWLAESGVSPSRLSFREASDQHWYNTRPRHHESYFYRRRRRRRRRRR